jgi:phosphoribosyl-ATP pyrophosphohydrolase/phosphoribosyl-AMP cyclohydrolase
MDINFDKLGGLIPAVIQDSDTQKVLMVGFMNDEALKKTAEEKKVTFYSRTQKRLWTKGETSGNYLHVKDILVDCDNDCILIKAQPDGPVCHTGADTCFFEKNNKKNLFFLEELENLIQQKKNTFDMNSYTCSLFAKGINKIAQKVGEEAVELIIESINSNNQEQFLNEAADLLYHFLVLVKAKECSLNMIINVLLERNSKK